MEKIMLGTLVTVAELQLSRDGGNVFKQLAYVTEEVGELSEALLNDDNESAKLEALDAAIAALAIFYQLGGDRELMNDHVPQALEKWYSNV